MSSASPVCTGAGHGSLQCEREPPAKRVRLNVPSAGQGRHREIGLMRWRSEQDAASFVGSASGIHFIRSVYSAVEAEKSRAASPIESPDQNLVPGEDDQLPGSSTEPTPKTLWHPYEVSTQMDDGILVSFSDLLEWSQSYFNDWHPAYPFLHAPAVLDTFKRVSQAPLTHLSQLPPLDLVIVRAILSISLADRRQQSQRVTTKPVPSPLIFPSFDAAIDSIQGTLSAATTTKALQAVISVQLFLVSLLRHNAASRLGGLIVRMAFQIGLHRCPVRYTSFSGEDVQLRKRIFWTIYCVDRHLCQSLGLPLTIRDDDLDVCYLSVERHAAKPGVDIGMDDRLALLQFLVRHAEIKGLTMELCNKSINHRQADPDATTYIIGKKKKLQNDIETFLDTVSDTGTTLSDYHQTTLTVLQHESTIALNRPLLAMPKDTADYRAALQSCIIAARSVVGQLYKYLNYFRQASIAPASSERPPVPPLSWPSFTWAVWQSAFILLYAAVEGDLPKANAIKYADNSVEILKHIASRGGVWPNACAAAIRDLRRHLDKPPKSARLNRSNASPRSLEASNSMAREESDSTDRLSTLAGAAETHGRPEAPYSSIATASSGMQPGMNGRYSNTVENAYTPDSSTTGAMTQIDSSFVVPMTPGASGFVLEYGAPYNPDLQTAIDLGGYNAPSAPSLNSDAIFDMNNPELFNGFDIPFWLDDGKYESILNESNGL